MNFGLAAEQAKSEGYKVEVHDYVNFNSKVFFFYGKLKSRYLSCYSILKFKSFVCLQMVIVGDDCALPPPRGIAGRRGLAGTIFVHKVECSSIVGFLSTFFFHFSFLICKSCVHFIS